MTKYKTSYKKDWESQVNWINSVVSGLCTLCNKTFKIDNRDISVVNAHGKRRHSEIEKQKKPKGFYIFKSCTNIVK